MTFVVRKEYERLLNKDSDERVIDIRNTFYPSLSHRHPHLPRHRSGCPSRRAVLCKQHGTRWKSKPQCARAPGKRSRSEQRKEEETEKEDEGIRHAVSRTRTDMTDAPSACLFKVYRSTDGKREMQIWLINSCMILHDIVKRQQDDMPHARPRTVIICRLGIDLSW